MGWKNFLSGVQETAVTSSNTCQLTDLVIQSVRGLEDFLRARDSPTVSRAAASDVLRETCGTRMKGLATCEACEPRIIVPNHQ